jgi:phage shock protein A
MSDRERYARVRQNVAGIYYARNRVAGEVAALEADVAQLDDAMRAALASGDEPAARELALRKATCVDAIARAKRALAEVRHEATEATAALVALREAMHTAEREKLLSRVLELSIAREVEQIG